jgi:hypothetical protein
VSRHLNNEGQECKTSHIKERALAGGGGGMKRVRGMKRGNLSKPFFKGSGGRGE